MVRISQPCHLSRHNGPSAAVSVFCFATTFPLSKDERFRSRDCNGPQSARRAAACPPAPSAVVVVVVTTSPLVAAVAMGFVSGAVLASAASLHRQPFDGFLPIPLPCGSIYSTQTSEGAVQGGFDHRLRRACAGPRASLAVSCSWLSALVSAS